MPWLALCNGKGLTVKINVPAMDISETVKFYSLNICTDFIFPLQQNQDDLLLPFP